MPRDADDKPLRITGAAAAGPVAIRAAAGTDADGRPKLPTFDMLAYTGAPMHPDGWWDLVVIDLTGVKIPSQHRPILRQHDHTRIVGHSTAITVSDKGIEASGVLSGAGPDAKEVAELARNGFQWQASVGANPIRREYLESGETATVNGREVTGPMVISRETVLGEISFVPLGADGATSATVSASRGGSPMNEKMLIKGMKVHGHIRAGKYSDEAIDKMTDDEAKAALKECMKGADDEEMDAEDDEEMDAEDDEEVPTAKAGKRTGIKGKGKVKAAGKKAAKASLNELLRESVGDIRAAAAAEIRRQEAIKARAAKHDVTHVTLDTGERVNLVAHAIDKNWTADQAELYALRAGRPAADVGGPLAYVTNKPDLNEAVLEAAVFHAARHQFRLDDDSFYVDSTPDGKGTIRRVPLHLQREAQDGFRSRYSDQVQQAAHTLFKGRIGPKQILHAAFGQWGKRHSLDLSGEHGVRDALKAWEFNENPAIRAEGTSQMSISNILANVLNKFALQGYLFIEQAWREVCAIRPVNDFKPTKSINLLGDVMYKQLGPASELVNASLGDQAFANQANPYGRILTIPWTHIVNDDLGMLTGAPMKIGQGAGLALNDNIWTLWAAMAAGTVNGDDGNPFWRTTSSTTAAAIKAGTAYKPNKTSGGTSVLAPAGMQVVKALFDNQIDPNGNPLGFNGLKPVLLFGPSNWQNAMQVLYASSLVYGGSTAAAAAPNFNAFQGFFNPVMSRYVESPTYVNSTTAWWMLFNPIALAAIEVCFLNGVDTPAVLQAGPEFQFDRLGISIRGTMPFGSNQQNFRGGVYAVGA
jgi:hypothetical protein